MTLLSLDLGTKMGWALYQTGTIKSGTLTLAPKGKKPIPDDRFLKFHKWLYTLKDIEVVYYEYVRRHKSTQAAHVYGGFQAILLAWACDHNVPYRCALPSILKRHVCGTGVATKEQVIEAVKALGFNPEDDNEADAIALLLYAIKHENKSNKNTT